MKKLLPALILTCAFTGLFAHSPNRDTNSEISPGPVMEMFPAASYEITMVRGRDMEGITLHESDLASQIEEHLVLEIDPKTYRSKFQWSVSLYNDDERVIQQQGIHDRLTMMDLAHLNPDMYYLRICSSYQEVKIFRIVKH